MDKDNWDYLLNIYKENINDRLWRVQMEISHKGRKGLRMSPTIYYFQLRTKHRSRGFSLVELMLYLAISSLIAMTIFSLLSFIVLELKRLK